MQKKIRLKQIIIQNEIMVGLNIHSLCAMFSLIKQQKYCKFSKIWKPSYLSVLKIMQKDYLPIFTFGREIE